MMAERVYSAYTFHIAVHHQKKSRQELSPFVAYQIAYQAAWYYGREYQILFAVHENKQLLHVHFVMNTVSYLDGHKYAGKREDYYKFQDYLIQILKPFGIDISLLA